MYKNSDLQNDIVTNMLRVANNIILVNVFIVSSCSIVQSIFHLLTTR